MNVAKLPESDNWLQVTSLETPAREDNSILSFELVNQFHTRKLDIQNINYKATSLEFNDFDSSSCPKAKNSLVSRYMDDIWLAKYKSEETAFIRTLKADGKSDSSSPNSLGRKDTSLNSKSSKRSKIRKTEQPKLLGRKIKAHVAPEPEAISLNDQKRLNNIRNGYCSAFGYFLDNPTQKREMLKQLKQYSTKFHQDLQELKKEPRAAFMLKHFPDSFENIENFFCQHVLNNERKESSAFQKLTVAVAEIGTSKNKKEIDWGLKSRWKVSWCDTVKCDILISKQAG